ncbi:hypothetical protein M413DRAFT_442013 [Hebeloma cylindrosporum]|uniref:cAMP-independent regulatory protein pac2 n=1 Tax=Hebeloma cylindrosporum TaxID=76867 RepID=A0A0C3CNF0_HEBCY|nr:hypothetical protein M413DRAFT_442013 [Hebeloma cylindrosporum h7]
MQQPTCSNIRIRSTADAHKIFGAVQQGILHMVTRRLDADERLALRSGCIYAWEERGPHSELTGLGIERFTEGRRWSPSRVRDEFLFYYEKYSPPPDAMQPGISAERQPPRDWDPLVKQTYSVWVQTDKGRRKWHLTAYFTQATIDQLGTIDDNPRVREVIVPDGMFKSTRVGKSRNRVDDHSRSDAAKAATTVPRTYAPFPTPYQYHPQGGSPSMTPVLMHEPYQRAPERAHSPYEQSPSPVSPEGHGSHFADPASYSGSNASNTPGPYNNSAYPTSPTSLPSSMDIHTNSDYHMTQDNHSYYSPAASPSSWNRNGHYYHPPPQQHLQHHHANSGYSSSSASATSHPPHGYPPNISAPIPMQVYSPSYSLQAALTPPPQTQALIAPAPHRGPQLSPLHIPMGHQVPGTESMVSPPINVGTGQEGEDCALAPLSVLRKSMTLRRDPSDEKTLRKLREQKSKS